MRTAYRENLDNFAHDLIIMCDMVGSIMDKATEALVHSRLEPAEEALSTSDDLEDIRQRCEERAVKLLALENPVASDLRQVVSSIYIVEDLNRMASLSKHVAKAARRRHPDPAVPEAYRGYFVELGRLVRHMCETTRSLLVSPDTTVALQLTKDDDAVDDINEHLLTALTMKEWEYTTREAVDLTLLARYYERFADHCVNVSARIVYLTTGLTPDQYLAERAEAKDREEMLRHFQDLEKQFHGRSSPRPTDAPEG
ncbi:phosphate signaling complex protein PhoU [Corynebacterium incognita]|uniref:Phosphate-specific transport system accessory protein PhoU n=1 Tax=Corynebacterium incognita TaxID=2754725 RepID=A0A7G7CSC3_9CORY|nr:phosphate signaling complex protein PhoU [Corynebacterium incognita]QNE90489.1 phosphate signaling complex protein PhoU [Corynebacterium incognita]